jgi:hypothetical protein
MHELVELIGLRVDDHTIEHDGIEGVTMRIYDVPKTALDPFRYWHGAGY